MNIGIGRIAEASAPYREKAKESTTATAIQAAAQEVLAQNPPESAEKIGIIGAYAQGPADIYRFNGGKLCERGIRGMRPQKAIHSILCEPACQTGITCHIKGFQMSVIGDKLELTVEVMQQKGGSETTETYQMTLPHNIDGIIINLPAYMAGLPEEAYLEEFIPAPSTEDDDEEAPGIGDDMGLGDF